MWLLSWRILELDPGTLGFEDIVQDEVGDRIELVGVCLMPKRAVGEMVSTFASGILSHRSTIVVGVFVLLPSKNATKSMPPGVIHRMVASL